MKFFNLFVATASICLLTLLSGNVVGQSDRNDVWLKFRDGSILKATVADQIIPWLTVEKDGTITNSEKKLSEVSELYLTAKPASEQIANIRRLIDQLASDDFRQRNAAEKALLTQGGPFVKLIQIATNSGEPEVRYRIDRILKELDSGKSKSIELDALIIGSAKIEGDVRDWQMVGKIGERDFALGRRQLSHIYFKNPLVHSLSYADATAKTIDVQHIIKPDSDFFKADQTHVSFDENADGQKPPRNTQVHDLFVFKGAKLACENPGWEVVVSGFSFMSSVSKGNSIGNHFQDPETGKHFRYTGVMEITFCQPGRKEIPVAVSLAGCFLEIVMPRHTIIEAYNAAGHRIGMVEASENRSSFVGFKSNEPIARLRVMPNEYLNYDQIEEDDLNEDYAVDDLCFSDPVLINDLNMSDKYKLLFASGESITCDGIKFDGENVNVIDKRFDGDGLVFHKSTIVSMLGPNRLAAAQRFNGQLKVMLADGSIVKATVAGPESFDLEGFGNKSTEQIVGFWSGDVALYPETKDLDDVSAVVVYPLNRFTARSFELTKEKFSIPPDSIERLHQNPDDATKGVPAPQIDVAAKGLSFGFSEAPSVWFKVPVIADPKSSLLRLNDGQQFMLGGESGFKLKSTSPQSVTIVNGDKEFEFPLADIAVLRF